MEYFPKRYFKKPLKRWIVMGCLKDHLLISVR